MLLTVVPAAVVACKVSRLAIRTPVWSKCACFSEQMHWIESPNTDSEIPTSDFQWNTPIIFICLPHLQTRHPLSVSPNVLFSWLILALGPITVLYITCGDDRPSLCVGYNIGTSQSTRLFQAHFLLIQDRSICRCKTVIISGLTGASCQIYDQKIKLGLLLSLVL